jgi:hypothetical protein
VKLNLQNLRLDTGIAIDIQQEGTLAVATADISVETTSEGSRYLIPIFFTRPRSTSSSIATQVSCRGVF